MRGLLARLAGAACGRPGLDIEMEASRLAALVDGLGLSGVLHPDLLPPQTSLDVLRTHLEGLARAG
ncbi:TetR family transcriptional regulator C-terminal domain-containing protein [Streptomyces goshikiensis]